MALMSRRMGMAAAFLAVLVVIVAAETATARVVVEEQLCLSASHAFKGPCWPGMSNNCDTICKTEEKFIGGECKMDGMQRKCFCKKVC